MERLLEVRDAVGVAKQLVALIYLASQAPTMPASERGALCAGSNAVREALEAVEQTLDALIAPSR